MEAGMFPEEAPGRGSDGCRPVLVALDCDGTLLRSDGTLGERTVQVVRELRRRGVPITLATGRRVSGALPYAQKLHLDDPLVLHNGAVLADPKTGESLRYLPLPVHATAEAIERGRRHDLDMIVFDDPRRREGAGFIERMPRNPVDRRFVQENIALIQNVPDLIAALPEQPLKAFFAGPPPVVESFYQEIVAWLAERRAGDEVRAILYGGPARETWAVELLNARAGKAEGVAEVAARHGLSLRDVIAFGDDMNDYDLLATCGFGVAMRNGVMGLQKVARRIAPSNDDEGVAVVLAELFGLNGRG